MPEIDPEENYTALTSPPFSKRAARRMIQRAFVLVGRDKRIRQHLREAELTSNWVLEDWDLTWTVILHRGRIEFERRPAKHPHLTFTWTTAADFFNQAGTGVASENGFQLDGPRELRGFYEVLLKGFIAHLSDVLRDPVDDLGESLL